MIAMQVEATAAVAVGHRPQAALAWRVIEAMPHSRFQRAPVEELARSSEERILEYAACAKAASEDGDARLAIQLMLFLHEQRMEDRVAVRLPRHLAHHRFVVAAWVLERVLASALRLQFTGTSVGEWVNWWHVAVDRQVIAFWRSSQGQSLEAETSLPSEHDGEPDAAHDRLGAAFDQDVALSRILYEDIVRTVLRAVDNPMHASVIARAIFDDQPSVAVAAEHDTTPNNVDAIKKRFREAVRQECLARGVVEL